MWKERNKYLFLHFLYILEPELETAKFIFIQNVFKIVITRQVRSYILSDRWQVVTNASRVTLYQNAALTPFWRLFATTDNAFKWENRHVYSKLQEN